MLLTNKLLLWNPQVTDKKRVEHTRSYISHDATTAAITVWFENVHKSDDASSCSRPCWLVITCRLTIQQPWRSTPHAATSSSLVRLSLPMSQIYPACIVQLLTWRPSNNLFFVLFPQFCDCLSLFFWSKYNFQLRSSLIKSFTVAFLACTLPVICVNGTMGLTSIRSPAQPRLTRVGLRSHIVPSEGRGLCHREMLLAA